MKIKSMLKVILKAVLGLTITLPTATDNKHIEGTAWTFSTSESAMPGEARKVNYTQIFVNVWKVTGTVEAAQKYGRTSEYDLRRAHALRAFKVDIEYELLDNTASAGGATTATAREMKGLPGAAVDGGITATANSVAANRSPLDESILNSMLQSMWLQGTNPNKLVVNGFVKRSIAGFLGGSAGRPIVNQNGDRVASNIVDIYESDFGRLDILMSRQTNPGSQVLAYQDDLLTLCWLRPPTSRPGQDDGDYRQGVVVGEGTFEDLNPNGVGRLTRVQSS